VIATCIAPHDARVSPALSPQYPLHLVFSHAPQIAVDLHTVVLRTSFIDHAIRIPTCPSGVNLYTKRHNESQGCLFDPQENSDPMEIVIHHQVVKPGKLKSPHCWPNGSESVHQTIRETSRERVEVWVSVDKIGNVVPHFLWDPAPTLCHLGYEGMAIFSHCW
jgi:hypothetical protein